MAPMQAKKSTDRIFRVLLWLCILAGAGSTIAWALGWEHGWFGVLMAGAFSGFPLFHFAMHWPIRDREESKSKENRE